MTVELFRWLIGTYGSPTMMNYAPSFSPSLSFEEVSSSSLFNSICAVISSKVLIIRASVHIILVQTVISDGEDTEHM